MQRILRAEDVAALMGVQVTTVQIMARRGILPARKVGKMWFFHEETLQKFLTTPTPPPPQKEVAGGRGMD